MQNQQDNTFRGRAGRAISDLVLAELLLVQATIESVSILSESISDYREHRGQDKAEDDSTLEFREFLKQTGEQLVEPYSARFKYLRDMVREDFSA
ncbi:MAG: hypothetical protein O7F73_12895 [Gammaproteobacteria bacterium]|nr:hypothetical protein [Gammaproteobacteria bacterium]